MKIIISKTNGIGDVLLALPMASYLKQFFPDCVIVFLCTEYTKAIVSACPDIDLFLNWDELSLSADRVLVQKFKSFEATHIIHLLPNSRIEKAAKLASIPFRFGNSHVPRHFLYCNRFVGINHRVPMHEVQYDLKFLKLFGLNPHPSLLDVAGHIHQKPKIPLSAWLLNLIDDTRFNLILHPGSYGNAREWPEDHFIELIHSLDKTLVQCFITGSEKECLRFSKLVHNSPDAVNLMGKLKLEEFMAFIASCHGIVAANTGPMHLGAAMGIHTLGLFPPIQKKDPVRWQPLGSKAQFLVSQKTYCSANCQINDCLCMRNVTPAEVKRILLGWLAIR